MSVNTERFKAMNIGVAVDIPSVKPDDYDTTVTPCGDFIFKSKVPQKKYVKPEHVNPNYVFVIGEGVTFTPPKSEIDPLPIYTERRRKGVILADAIFPSYYNPQFMSSGYKILGDNGVEYNISRYDIHREKPNPVPNSDYQQWREWD